MCQYLKYFNLFVWELIMNFIWFYHIFIQFRWRTNWRCKRNSPGKSISLARLECLSWPWLFIRVVWFSSFRIIKWFKWMVSFHSWWKIGDNVFKWQSRKWQRQFRFAPIGTFSFFYCCLDCSDKFYRHFGQSIAFFLSFKCNYFILISVSNFCKIYLLYHLKRTFNVMVTAGQMFHISC